MKMNFDDFIKIKNIDYPGIIDMSFNAEEREVKLKIRMSGFSTDKINSISIKIPEKYEQIRMN